MEAIPENAAGDRFGRQMQWVKVPLGDLSAQSSRRAANETADKRVKGVTSVKGARRG